MLCKRLCLYQDRLQSVKNLLSMLPKDMATRVWAGIVGPRGPREVASDGPANSGGPVQAPAGATEPRTSLLSEMTQDATRGSWNASG